MESETRRAPAAVAVVPTPEVLGEAVKELAHLARVTAHVIYKLSPSPEAGDLRDLIDRRLRGIEAALTGAGD